MTQSLDYHLPLVSHPFSHHLSGISAFSGLVRGGLFWLVLLLSAWVCQFPSQPQPPESSPIYVHAQVTHSHSDFDPAVVANMLDRVFIWVGRQDKSPELENCRLETGSG
jgi:hypothetical protein